MTYDIPADNSDEQLSNKEKQLGKYSEMNEGEKIALLRLTVSTANINNVPLREYKGSGYLQYSVETFQEKPPVSVNELQTAVARQFVDEVVVRLQKKGLNPTQIFQSENDANWQQFRERQPEALISFLTGRYGSFLDVFEFSESDRPIQFLEGVLSQVCTEFKIHLQPDKDSIPEVTKRLASAISHNETLRQSIQAFKVSISDDSNEVFPEIVIYPKLGKQHYGTVLKIILEVMSIYEQKGTGKVPRRNNQLNRLVHVTQSGGDFKNMLDQLGILDRYFDKSKNYAFALPPTG